MKIAGIIAEYNPMHDGHTYHISETRKALGEDAAIVCAMSGDFVQRGDCAVFSKFTRAEAAVRAGADLVAEIPLPWVVASAEKFAEGGTAVLAALGAQFLCFGSECGDMAAIEQTAKLLLEPGITDEIKALLKTEPELSFAAAREQVVTRYASDAAAILENPNNILAVEYCKAIHRLGLSITPMTVRRIGSAHDGTDPTLPSAMALRTMLSEGKCIDRFVPPEAMQVYQKEIDAGRLVLPSAVELAILSRLRMLKEADFEALPDAGGGLGKRLYAAVKTESSLASIAAAAKSKRYALSRIRRMLLCAALGISAEHSCGLPGYVRILAANDRGLSVLKDVSYAGNIPVITKPSAVRKTGERNMETFDLGSKAHDLYVLGYHEIDDRRGEADWRKSPIIIHSL